MILIFLFLFCFLLFCYSLQFFLIFFSVFLFSCFSCFILHFCYKIFFSLSLIIFPTQYFYLLFIFEITFIFSYVSFALLYFCCNQKFPPASFWVRFTKDYQNFVFLFFSTLKQMIIYYFQIFLFHFLVDKVLQENFLLGVIIVAASLKKIYNK